MNSASSASATSRKSDIVPGSVLLSTLEKSGHILRGIITIALAIAATTTVFNFVTDSEQ